jgi:chemotaxis protein methyltransferase CheR
MDRPRGEGYSQMIKDDFLFFQKFLKDKSGLSIGEDKIYLLDSRLTPIMKECQYTSLSDVVKALRFSTDAKLAAKVINAMTTNETLFFRDDKPFRYFRDNLLPGVIKSKNDKRTLRIWSAACSTGQEPYSIAMILKEILPEADQWRIEILATYISPTVLDQARKGRFSQFEIQRGLPIQMVMKYFQQDGTSWFIKDTVRSMVKFESFNLLEGMERFGTFDIIFCRNVLIYFDEATKKAVLDNLGRRLDPEGYLFLGASETVLGLCPALKYFAACSGLYMLDKNTNAAKLSA